MLLLLVVVVVVVVEDAPGGKCRGGKRSEGKQSKAKDQWAAAHAQGRQRTRQPEVHSLSCRLAFISCPANVDPYSVACVCVCMLKCLVVCLPFQWLWSRSRHSHLLPAQYANMPSADQKRVTCTDRATSSCIGTRHLLAWRRGCQAL